MSFGFVAFTASHIKMNPSPIVFIILVFIALMIVANRIYRNNWSQQYKDRLISFSIKYIITKYNIPSHRWEIYTKTTKVSIKQLHKNSCVWMNWIKLRLLSSLNWFKLEPLAILKKIFEVKSPSGCSHLNILSTVRDKVVKILSL